ncbi:MAG: transketolase [Anaerolineae bacterium]|nr:transketolase [Anaerolineae bacterium]MCB9132362.1 transketolase [Anaerolineales bacterium]MCB0228260.1 transketolase [Anaerolineae bacterium]MCB0233058.1 transketolase [Anaerolineae bacterium]MCB0239359.1 transketolase [Anaerolineae bacterium]
MTFDPVLANSAINTIRFLAVDGVQKANSGHPGAPMGAAPMTYVLWNKFLRHNPGDPSWPDRDRFVLSAGHASMLLYSLLHLTGYDLPLAQLQQFRQWGSLTPGHPEYGLTSGIETTTGPLGQGFANGVGMAIAAHHLAAVFNQPGHEIVDHTIFAVVSDGDLMEGVSSEAASLAGHLQLGRLVYLYDDNHISIDGGTDLAFTEDRMMRFQAYGWHTQVVADGNDLEAIAAAISAAKAETTRPSIIAVRTIIGYGSPHKANTSGVHGEPLGADEVLATKANLGWPAEPTFYIPGEVLEHFREALETGKQRQAEWQARFDAYAAEYPELAAEWQRRFARELPADWDADLPAYATDAKGQATRNVSGSIINALAARVPELIGGSADLAPSTKTIIKGSPAFQPGSYEGRNFHFGVREHGMGSILNGMYLHGGVRPYGATFMVFSDYMRPPIRLAALMEIPTIFIFTHDSIGLGEDGPTHQPVEHLAALRAIPHVTVLRPADARETVAAWQVVMTHKGGPLVLALTRQNVPTLEGTSEDPEQGVGQGGYVLADWPEDVDGPRVILISTGSEVHLAVAAREQLTARGIAARVVSLPSWELFDAQPSAYQESVLPHDGTPRIAIEAGVSMGWERYAATFIGINRFGASAPYQTIYKELGLTADNIVAHAVTAVEERQLAASLMTNWVGEPNAFSGS